MTIVLGFLVDRTKTKIYVAKGKENPTVATMALIPDDTNVVLIFTT
jgi:hypothetical protein